MLSGTAEAVPFPDPVPKPVSGGTQRPATVEAGKRLQSAICAEAEIFSPKDLYNTPRDGGIVNAKRTINIY